MRRRKFIRPLGTVAASTCQWGSSREAKGKTNCDHERGNTMIKGSCLCGGIGFEIDAVRSLTHCHCRNCRKLTGAAFGSYVHVDADKFRLLSGKDLMQRFESSTGSFRTFCKVCGSIAPSKATYLTTLSIPAGLLDNDPGVRPKLHVFVSSKAPWWDIADGLPQHEKWVPGFAPKEQA